MLPLSQFLKEGSTTISNLLLTNYKKLDLNEQELILYLQLWMYHEKENFFPNMEEIAQLMDLSLKEIYELIQSLINKKIVAIDSIVDEQGRGADQYNLFLVYERLTELFTSQKQQVASQKNEQAVIDMYQSFEKEFGRMLSPIERETIGYWLEDDQYSLELIQLALREAVLNQAYNLKYIDRILLSWERKNLQTKNQVMQELNRRKNSLSEQDKQQFKQEENVSPKVPLYNWLDPDNQS